MSESKQSPRRVLAAERRKKAMAMRKRGATFATIADALGVSEPSAYRMVQKGLARLNELMMVDAEALRRETVEQLEALLAVHLPRALDGDVKSGNLAIRALSERAKITGVVKHSAVVPTTNPFESMTPDELRAEAHRLGIYDYPQKTSSAGPSVNGTNGQSPLSLPRRNHDGSLRPG
jgi:hypothetical protein